MPVVAGFQGIASDGRVTTLGRGGSDISAVALAAAVLAPSAASAATLTVQGEYVDFSHPTQVNARRTTVYPQFSPDGKRLLYADTSGFGDLWTLPLDAVDSDNPKPGKPELFLRADRPIRQEADF